jgi:hypothetical protein
MKNVLMLVYIFILLISASASFADENTDQKTCRPWNDAQRSVCPDYQPKGTSGERVLAIGDRIVTDGTRRTGGCWDFVNAVYNCAGYPEKSRAIIFQSKGYEKGPYLEDWDTIQPGDWIMHINVDYRSREGITHSTIFVSWKDKEQKIAKTLDYVGEKRCTSAHYSEHDLTEIYCIYRAIAGTEEVAE